MLVYLIQPFLVETREAVPASHRGVDDKNAILDEIEDIDLEHAAGKIPDAAYGHIRAELVARAAQLLDVEAEVEAAKPQPVRAFCSHCGKAVESGDRYCAACGETISASRAESERKSS